MAGLKKFKKPVDVLQKDYRLVEAELDNIKSKMLKRFGERCIEILEGRNRRVFVMNGYVIKVPMNWNGVADNDWEGAVSNGSQYPQSDYNIQYPKKRVVYVDDIPILFMEYVKPAGTKLITKLCGRVPKWVDQIDCGQVGFNKKGRLVAYDYGIR